MSYSAAAIFFLTSFNRGKGGGLVLRPLLDPLLRVEVKPCIEAKNNRDQSFVIHPCRF